MKNRFGILPVVVLAAVLSGGGIETSRAALSWIGNAYVELKPGTDNNQYYWVNQDNNVDPHFTGNLGGLQINYGQELYLGGQAQTYQPTFGTTVRMHYAVDSYDNQSSFVLNYLKNENSNDWWDTQAAVNINNNLNIGTHTLYIWYSGSDGGTPVWNNANGNNFSATFSVVPEPTTVALGIFGGLALAGLVIRQVRLRAAGGSSFKLKTLAAATSSL
jgi:hypothetical protein